MKRTIWLAALLLSGCGGGTEVEQPAQSEIPPLPAPLSAPLQAREFLMKELDQQKALATDRRAAMDQVVEQRRR